jgi:hypothetical protein
MPWLSDENFFVEARMFPLHVTTAETDDGTLTDNHARCAELNNDIAVITTLKQRCFTSKAAFQMRAPG